MALVDVWKAHAGGDLARAFVALAAGVVDVFVAADELAKVGSLFGIAADFVKFAVEDGNSYLSNKIIIA